MEHAKPEIKTYTLTLNRLSKIIERVAVLRAEANSKVNELIAIVTISPKDVDTAYDKLKETNKALNVSLARTKSLIALQHYLRGVMMKSNAANGVTDLLMLLEEIGQRSKFNDHLLAQIKGGSIHLHRLGISGAVAPRLDEAEPLLAELKESADKVKAFLKEFSAQGMNDRDRDLGTQIRGLVNGAVSQNVAILPLTKEEVKAIEDDAAYLRRKANSLQDELSALNATKVNIDLPVDVAMDVGLTA